MVIFFFMFLRKPSYTGSSTSIKTNNSTQQTIKDQMNANSIAWWNADDTEKQRLKEENQRLAALLGGSVSYDPGTGYWSGTADADVITKHHRIFCALNCKLKCNTCLYDL